MCLTILYPLRFLFIIRFFMKGPPLSNYYIIILLYLLLHYNVTIIIMLSIVDERSDNFKIIGFAADYISIITFQTITLIFSDYVVVYYTIDTFQQLRRLPILVYHPSISSSLLFQILIYIFCFGVKCRFIRIFTISIFTTINFSIFNMIIA